MARQRCLDDDHAADDSSADADRDNFVDDEQDDVGRIDDARSDAAHVARTDAIDVEAADDDARADADDDGAVRLRAVRRRSRGRRLATVVRLLRTRLRQYT